jgi:hypothetical protein
MIFSKFFLPDYYLLQKENGILIHQKPCKILNCRALLMCRDWGNDLGQRLLMAYFNSKPAHYIGDEKFSRMGRTCSLATVLNCVNYIFCGEIGIMAFNFFPQVFGFPFFRAGEKVNVFAFFFKLVIIVPVFKNRVWHTSYFGLDTKNGIVRGEVKRNFLNPLNSFPNRLF